MSRFLSGFGVFALIAISLGFAFFNSSQRVTLRLGLVTLYGVPLTAVAFGSVIAGMVVMLIAGVRSDLKVRKVLRARLAEEDREERERFEDLSQHELFSSDDDTYGDPPRLTH